MASNITNKRRRTADNTLHISDLPIGFMVNVAEYLPKPSRAILAVALSASSYPLCKLKYTDHNISPISTAIISAQQWDILDFEETEGELANKLTDNDMFAILKCINAHDVLKKLKLCGCLNIEGHGLYPLRGSVVLEQIDLSLLAKHEELWDPPWSKKISHLVIVPILESIISANDCSLKYIQFPRKWWDSSYTQIHHFIERYNELFNTRDINCSKCEEDMSNVSHWMEYHTHRWYPETRCKRMLNNRICYDCLEPICHDCSNEEEFTLQCCICCEKTFCSDCVPVPECVCCSDRICVECEDMKACGECGEVGCSKCLHTCDICNRTQCEDCVGMNRCGGRDCSKEYCDDCNNEEEYNITSCKECHWEYCVECKLDSVKKGGADRCRSCAADIVPLILEENAKLSKENEEMADLRREINKLKGNREHSCC